MRDGGNAGMRPGERFDHLAHPGGADTFHKHIANALIQLRLTSLIALKELRTKSIARARHGLVFDFSDHGHQVAFIIAIAVTLPFGCPLVKCGLDKVVDLLFIIR